MIDFTKSFFKQLLLEEKIDRKALPNLVVEQYLKNKLKISVAESCTGGLISKKITDISGSSGMFECGVCTYSNDMKEKLLNVKHSTLVKYGAVSEFTALEMAQGVRMLSNSDISVATTGVAGPTGGTKTKPVGLVYIAISTKKRDICYKLHRDDTTWLSRETIRELASDIALYVILTYSINIK